MNSTATLRSGLTVRITCDRDEDSTLWRVHLPSGQRVAKVNTAVRDGWLRLNDLHVERRVSTPSANWWRRWRGQPDTLHPRGQGLGSVLLVEVQREAQRRGLQGVTGTFTPETPADAVDLARFYTRHGFTLTGQDLQWVPDA